MTKQLSTHKINKSSLAVSVIFKDNFKGVKESKRVRTSVLQDRVLVLCSYVIKTVHYSLSDLGIKCVCVCTSMYVCERVRWGWVTT